MPNTSQLDIDLDRSSTMSILSYSSKKRTGKSKFNVESKQQDEDDANPYDVWAVLRNINRFQFRPSPPMSEDSFITPKKRKRCKRRNNRKDTRVVETRTAEYAYISSFGVDNRSPHSFSKSSSFGRITVIDKEDDFSKICQEFGQRIVESKKIMRCANNKPQNKILNNRTINNITTTKPKTRNPTQKPKNPKMLVLEYNTKKQCQSNCGNTLLNKLQENRYLPVTGYIKNHLENEYDDDQVSNEIDEFEEIEIYPGDSGSVKAANSKITTKLVSDKCNLKQASDEFNNTLNGIIKVILSKGEKRAPLKKLEHSTRKRQGTITPSSHPVVPKSNINASILKLTKADIKRRLAKLQFPIVILGKDQLSSTYVLNPDPIQFNGMNAHIWPFMTQWQYNDSEKRDTLKTKTNSFQKKYNPEVVEYNKTLKANRECISPKYLNKKITNDSKMKVKVEHKRITQPAELQQQSQPNTTKPIRQLKDKMLKLIYKNASILNFVGENNQTDDVINHFASKNTKNKVDASTDTSARPVHKDMPRNALNSPIIAAKQVPITKQTWSKARWPSGIIDNVIRNIKNGVYHTHDSNLPNQKHERKEAEIQTTPMANSEGNHIIQSISRITITKQHDFLSIPGFDNTLPALEIKTLNRNEITVKNSVTNIMVHFDITIPNEPVINLNRSSSLIPINRTGSQTKVFKCKTTIINSMLPAELCYIIPKMMRSIVESSQALALPVVPQNKSVLNLQTMSEINRCRSPGPEPLLVPFLPHLRMTFELQKLINGLYPHHTVSEHEPKRLKVRYRSHLVQELLPRLSRRHLFDCVMRPTLPVENPCLKQTNLTPVNNFKDKLNTCMVLEPYPAADQKLVPAFNHLSLTNILQRISSYVTHNSSCLRGFNYLIEKNITINLTAINSHGLEDKLSINLNSLMTSYENFIDSDNTFKIKNKMPLPAIKLTKIVAPFYKNPQCRAYVNNKIKKKCFIKRYRKLKSTSNLTGMKTSTSLSKITNLDDFFQAIGATQLFSGVFDSVYSQKILSTLKEMKSWTTDINPTQALLVLLLLNKRDTPSLVRFRPVLLQGIAVNRITRANELDMEIEVIERENLKRLSQPANEGISYIPASPENEDVLLEELWWIAKTTASDYQRTFDESSEKLLKSLLQRRKKLNPSYLRVMARYVGLGLLKTQNKK